MIFVHGSFGDDRRTGRKNGMKERRTGKGETITGETGKSTRAGGGWKEGKRENEH